ncbi:MAG TPA: Maf family protein [Thermoleophilaceae bacterium]|nr:Maf family protein [Thermoleophilaceae bacterium]
MLTLASASPQRRAILAQLGVEFEVVVPEVDELTEGDPRATVVENAVRKARAVQGDLVLAADTEVVLDGRVFGKAADAAEAELFLRRLSGRTHEVWGGLALRNGRNERTASAVTRVRFRRLEAAELAWYIGTGEWRERAGAYAIQGRGAALVEEIEGDFWNVVGLPVAELVKLAPELLA